MPEHYTFIPKLANVEVRAAESEGSFEIPSREEREDLWPDDLVKLIFLNIGERLWVKVLPLAPQPLAAVNRDGTDPGTGRIYSGIVISDPVNPAMSRGDKVSFNPEHVADIAHVSLRKARERQARETHCVHRKPHHQKGKPCLPTGR
jgi:hypothetical protein